jgi:hypothetical protein
MDYCPCKKSALDLEEGYSRMLGAYHPLAVLEDGGIKWISIEQKKEEQKMQRYGATNDEVLQYAIDRTKEGDIEGAGNALKNYVRLTEGKPCCGGGCQ